MGHICMYPLTRLIFYLVQMFFVFNLLNFRYFNEKLGGEKRIKEPNSGGMAQEEKPVGRERTEEKKNCCPSSWFFQFKDAMSNKVSFYIVVSSSETQGQIVGARESLNGRENIARRKVKNGENSPWGQCLTRPAVLASDWCQKTFVFFCPNLGFADPL